ncbi:MAG: FAD-dependent thymidylate synthase [Alphaproteobacteria bacterium]|nr:FAD-dependent thymidylate synthase [Alphaproteobacteria bacterium]
MAEERDEQAETDALREAQSPTRRATVPALEDILYTVQPVLDRGFVRLIDYMGDDGAVVQAARVSYGKGTSHVSGDRGLIRYLMRHRHTTPFEMCEIKLHVKLPIFVARQWIRHRTANVNEYSGRYSILSREFYVPDEQSIDTRLAKLREESGQNDLLGDEWREREAPHLAAQSRSNKQGRAERLPPEEAAEAVRLIRAESRRAYTNYEKLLNEHAGEPIEPEAKGLARELARMVLPTNFYTEWYWKTDLHNLLHFLSLRADAHAQYEIRVYAAVIADIVKRWVPLTFEAFEDYVMGGTRLSALDLSVIKRLIAGEPITQKDSGLSAREWRELMDRLGRED